MATAFELAVFGWFAGTIATYADAPVGVAVVVLTLAAPLLQPQFLTFAAVRHLAVARGPAWRAEILAACAWVGTEWACGKLFADTLGYPLYGSPWMRQAADLAGAPGLTLVLVLANQRAFTALRALVSDSAGRARARAALAPAAALGALLMAVLVYGAVRWRTFAEPVAGARSLTAAIVQANLSHYDRLAAEIGTYEAVRRILDEHFALSREALGRAPDLVVWPETVYPTTFGMPKSEDGAAFDREIAAFVAASGVPLIFGSYEREGEREFNAAFFLTPQEAARIAAAPPGGAPTSFEIPPYRKRWLFPLTEYVPPWLDSATVRRWLPWLGTWQRGPGARAVRLPLAGGRAVRVAPLICYDALAPAHALAEVRDGAELLVTLSNDSWLLDAPGAWLHFLGAAFLSIETRRPQLRATPTGISAVIDATGAIVVAAGEREHAALVAPITLGPPATTLRLAWGEWLGPTSAIACLVGLLATLLRRIRG
jgi:apolipoprotein N-acyltransferase